eukprot:TRINITY_DN10750_c0_g1_i2.p1 TRINITY_DN10750_c0_g1~~TRINITY_DN10750_c0_g1_i2.p1  ORF type:complete len:260 (+),score=-66.91 TRINITY_DN10750_c0_g1_i2:430-1209(+)
MPVFERNTQGIYLTEAGYILSHYAEHILLLCDQAYNSIAELRNSQKGTLVLGASQTTGTYLIPRLIGIFKQHYPQIIVKLHVYSTKQVCYNVFKGNIDLALVGGEVPNEYKSKLYITPYAEDELVLILPKSHPFSKLEFLQKEDLYRLRFITLDAHSTLRILIETSLAKQGINCELLRVELELNSIEAIKNAVQAGLGASFLSISAIAKELELGVLHSSSIENLSLKRMLYVITNSNRRNLITVKAFNQEILTLFSSRK